MREYGFSMSRMFPCKDKIVDFVLIQENTGQRKPVFSQILCSVITGETSITFLITHLHL